MHFQPLLRSGGQNQGMGHTEGPIRNGASPSTLKWGSSPRFHQTPKGRKTFPKGKRAPGLGTTEPPPRGEGGTPAHFEGLKRVTALPFVTIPPHVKKARRPGHP